MIIIYKMMELPQVGKELVKRVFGNYADHYPLQLKMTLLMGSFALFMSMAEKTNWWQFFSSQLHIEAIYY